jgi:hypothetical protein
VNENKQGEYMKVGDILVSCWGYSMTLYDFFKVVKMTDKSATLVHLESTKVGGDGWNPIVAPTDVVCTRHWSKPFTRRLTNDGKAVSPGNGRTYATVYNGEECREDHMD